ncbi:MAG: helix-turn-helix transcriptional regulator [Bacteroidetes bacterium]|nr:helix-turn-helix transcriptional regulator [Bacteroidota bacterium]MBL6944445.1 helix-turn-helix transcriptional regulator [Bacteroidales bacterium]
MQNTHHEKYCQIFKALSHVLRLQIVIVLDNERCVTDVMKILSITQPVTSHHLCILKKRGIVNYRKEGKRIIYFVNNKCIKEIISIVMK